MDNQDEQLLTELYYQGTDILTLAKKFNYKTHQIVSKLEKLGLLDNNENIVQNLSDEDGINKQTISCIIENFHDENSVGGISVKINCLDCSYSTIFSPNEVSEIINAPSKLKYLGRLFGRIICNICDSPRLIFKQENNGVTLFDVRNLSFCIKCGDPISILRLNAMKKTNTCSICADVKNDIILSPRINAAIQECPKCKSNIYVVVRPQDGSKVVFCSNYTSDTEKQKKDEFCSWSDSFIDHEEYDNHSKNYYQKLRSLRLKYAKLKNLSPYQLLSNNEMRVISEKRPNCKKDLESLNLSSPEIKDGFDEEICKLFMTNKA